MRAPLIRLSCLLSLWIASSASAVTMDWTPIGNPGNPCDPQPTSPYGIAGGCFGSVGYSYSIGTYEVTTAQYVEFLNAVARSDPNGLWDASMAPPYSNAGITRSGISGAYAYSAIPGRENMPVNHVSFFSTLRFANWLQNGQLIGFEGVGTTETGAYTLTAQGMSNNTITRNSNASIVLASENEWYKAAYYDPTTSSYLDYPAGSNAQVSCAAPTAMSNRANCDVAAGRDLTNVGSYSGSASPYHAFDLGGNVEEWNDTIINSSNGSGRGYRGGDFLSTPSELARVYRSAWAPTSGNTSEVFGFRVALIITPEPSTGLLVIAGLLGLAAYRRQRA
jgi:formylglycine-generating enzyme required for sulfatase activity